MESIDFCKDCWRKKKWRLSRVRLLGRAVPVLPGASFSTSYERILEATNRIERYLETVGSPAQV